MPTPTYDLIASNVLTTNTTTVTFSSIPSTYRDLVLVSTIPSATDWSAYGIRFNSDTGNNYSNVWMTGDGSTTESSTSGTTNYIWSSSYNLLNTTDRYLQITHIMDYSATDKHKTVLIRQDSPANRAIALAGRWANTSAITTVSSTAAGAQFSSGSTFYLYGIVS